LVPLLAMFLSDIFIGFHENIIFIYASMLIIVFLGFFIKQAKSSIIILFNFIASCIFFVLSNFSVWAMTSYYPKNLAGLSACYIAAIPFFANTLISSLVYSALLFSLY